MEKIYVEHGCGLSRQMKDGEFFGCEWAMVDFSKVPDEYSDAPWYEELEDIGELYAEVDPVDFFPEESREAYDRILHVAEIISEWDDLHSAFKGEELEEYISNLLDREGLDESDIDFYFSVKWRDPADAFQHYYLPVDELTGKIDTSIEDAAESACREEIIRQAAEIGIPIELLDFEG